MIAKKALKENKKVFEVLLSERIMSEQELNTIFDDVISNLSG